MWRAVLSGVLLLCGADAQEYSVAPKRLPTDEVDRTMAAAQPGSDEWTSEAQADEIEQAIEDFGKQHETIGSLLDENFLGSPPPADEGETAKSGGAIELRRRPGSSEAPVNGERFTARMAEWLKRFENLTYTKFKIVSVKPIPDSAVETDVVYTYRGMGAGQSHLQETGRWRLQWVRNGDHWQIRGLEWLESASARSAKKLFSDVTAEALAGNSSYHRQLQFGMDHWRSTLDAVTGIAVTGHHGIAVADVDGDGWEDFYVAQPPGLPNLLFRNNADGTFSDISARAGVDVLDATAAALFVDVDNDGDPDLVLAGTEVWLFRNDGNGRFRRPEDTGFELALESFGSLMSIAAADYDNDGYLDLYLCAHSKAVWGGVEDDELGGLPHPFHDANNGAPNILLRNRRDGRFEDVTKSSGIDQNNRRFSFAAGWADYDEDGDQDLYVANDFGRNNLYRNNGDGTFNDVAAEAGVEDVGAGMSVAWEDYDNDGRLDLYVGNMWSSAGQRVTSQDRFRSSSLGEAAALFQRHARGSSLFRNNGNGTFSDVSEKAGVTLGRWAWSSEFVDFDNDGLEDIYVANGFITGEDTGDL